MKNSPATVNFPPGKNPARPSNEFCHPPMTPAKPGAKPAKPLNSSLCRSGPSADNDPYPLQIMIAIEPHPVHTHLSMLFDRDVDAIEDVL
ncbi:MAG: hypothetical protein ABSA39_08475 [Edaphobacter sp.]